MATIGDVKRMEWRKHTDEDAHNPPDSLSLSMSVSLSHTCTHARTNVHREVETTGDIKKMEWRKHLDEDGYLRPDVLKRGSLFLKENPWVNPEWVVPRRVAHHFPQFPRTTTRPPISVSVSHTHPEWMEASGSQFLRIGFCPSLSLSLSLSFTHTHTS